MVNFRFRVGVKFRIRIRVIFFLITALFDAFLAHSSLGSLVLCKYYIEVFNDFFLLKTNIILLQLFIKPAQSTGFHELRRYHTGPLLLN